MHIRHRERTQTPETHQFAVLLPPEAISGHLNHLQGEVSMRDRHVVIHQKLPEACRKSQKERSLVGFDRVLPCRKPVKILLQCRVVHVIHDRGLDLDCTHLAHRVHDMRLE